MKEDGSKGRPAFSIYILFLTDEGGSAQLIKKYQQIPDEFNSKRFGGLITIFCNHADLGEYQGDKRREEEIHS